LSESKEIQIENLQESIMIALNSEDPSERCTAVESLTNENLSKELVKTLCSMVDDADKGVRNSVDYVLSSNPNPDIPFNLVKYISSDNINTRNLAGEILLKIGSSSTKAMLDKLKSSNDDDIKFLIDILGLIADEKAAPSILDVLLTNKNENVILACIEALGNLKYQEALEPIISLYETNELYKATIIEAIGKIGSSKALNFITSNFQSEDDLTKFSMIESLGMIGNEETLFFLISLLSELNGPLIWPIIESIFILKEKFNIDVPFDERMKNLILNTIDEADARYKKTAAKLITVYDSNEIMPACLKIYGEDFETDEIIKPKIFEGPEQFFKLLPSFINTDSKNLISLLELTVELLSSEGLKNKEILTSIEIRELADSCTICLDNPDEEVRKLAIEILFTIDQEIALLFMDKMLEDNSMWNKLKLLEILTDINTPEVEHAVAELTKDDEEMISDRAKYILEEKLGIKQVSNTEGSV